MGLNPYDMFMKNRAQKYKTKLPFTSNYLEQCIIDGAKWIGWTEKWHKPGAMGGVRKHGIGMALGGYPFRPGLGAATIRLNPDGTAHVLVGVTDIGTGAKTTMAIIASEALGIPLTRIQLTNGDTDATPYSVGESGSRTTAFTGPAVVAAAEDVRRQIFNRAAGQLKAKADELDLRDGEVFVKSDPAQKLPLEKVVQNAGELIGRATTNPAFKDAEGKSFAAHFAEVEVDTVTGHVRITRYVAVHDSGTILNRLAAESQVKGGVVQGVGMAFSEELLIDRVTGIPDQSELPRRQSADSSRSAGGRSYFHRKLRLLRCLRWQSGRRAADYPGRGDNCQCDLQRHRSALQRIADLAGKNPACGAGLKGRFRYEKF